MGIKVFEDKGKAYVRKNRYIDYVIHGHYEYTDRQTGIGISKNELRKILIARNWIPVFEEDE